MDVWIGGGGFGARAEGGRDLVPHGVHRGLGKMRNLRRGGGVFGASWLKRAGSGCMSSSRL
jgi:hypothetical protein